jgi:hypothetical protein
MASDHAFVSGGQITPFRNAPKGFPIVLFDMHITEDIGFENLIS